MCEKRNLLYFSAQCECFVTSKHYLNTHMIFEHNETNLPNLLPVRIGWAMTRGHVHNDVEVRINMGGPMHVSIFEMR